MHRVDQRYSMVPGAWQRDRYSRNQVRSVLGQLRGSAILGRFCYDQINGR
jgi:hypothetical protein